MATRHIPLPVARFGWAWRTIQYAGLVAVVVLVALLFLAPAPALGWTWNVVVPLLPASFLVSPAIWRNVCPLATLNELPGRWGVGDRIPGRWATSGTVAIIALALLIPGRRALLNTNAEAFAAAILALAVLALAMGLFFAGRAGFCNSLCPILPVERLYGQHPLVQVRGSRCATCTFCTPHGCIDLARDKALAQIFGSTRHSARWLFTPTGLFATAFPGLVLAYFTAADATVGPTFAPFGRALLFGGISLVGLSAIVFAARVRSALAMTLLGGLAFGLYYWYAAPGIATQLGLEGAAGNLIRLAAGLLLLAWLARARNRSQPSERART